MPYGGGVDAEFMSPPRCASEGVVKLAIVAVAIKAGVNVFVGSLAKPFAGHADQRRQVAVKRRHVGGEYGDMKRDGGEDRPGEAVHETSRVQAARRTCWRKKPAQVWMTRRCWSAVISGKIGRASTSPAAASLAGKSPVP